MAKLFNGPGGVTNRLQCLFLLVGGMPQSNYAFKRTAGRGYDVSFHSSGRGRLTRRYVWFVE